MSALVWAEVHAGLLSAGLRAFVATYTAAGGPTIEGVRVIRREGVLDSGSFSTVQSVRVEIQISLADVPLPAPGAVLEFDGKTYELERMTDRKEGAFSLWLVKP